MSNQGHPAHYATQLETISGLAQWRNWFLGLAAATGIVAYPFFYGTSEMVANAFYVVICALAAGTLIKCYRDARFLDVETRLASRQVNDLIELDDIEQFLGNAHPSLFRTHIDSLYTIFLAHSDIDQSALIELLHRRLIARNRVSELFSSLLITLGLIGTIVGLIIMMSKLQETMAQFDSGEPQQIINLIFSEGGALSGLDAAFYTTLLGAMLGGVLLRVLSSIVASNTMHYVSHLAELTEVNVIPACATWRRGCANPAITTPTTDWRHAPGSGTQLHELFRVVQRFDFCHHGNFRTPLCRAVGAAAARDRGTARVGRRGCNRR